MLKLLYDYKDEGISMRDLSKKLDKDIRTIYYMVNKLSRKRFVEKIKIYNQRAVILKFDKPYFFYKIKCPKCNEVFNVDSETYYVTCRNKGCYYKKSRFRFIVNNKNIIEVINLFKNEN